MNTFSQQYRNAETGAEPLSMPTPDMTSDGTEGHDLPRQWTDDEPYHYAPKTPDDPWGHCRNAVEKYDAEVITGWKEEIDTLLVFAGLFSAVVTAFVIESYQWLQPNNADTSLAVLLQIARKLNDPDETSVPSIPNQDDFRPESVSVRINVFWFLSITMSLSASLIGILCKQWLREYLQDASVTPKDFLRLRQMRYRGFEYWGVPKILSSLPVILESALVLFFAGILELLWSLNTVVASVATAVIGLTMLLVVFTTIMPTLYFVSTICTPVTTGYKRYTPALCPYKSPQSWMFHLLTVPIMNVFAYFVSTWGDPRASLTQFTAVYRHTIASRSNLRSHKSWVLLELLLLPDFVGVRFTSLRDSIKWIHANLSNTMKTMAAMLACLRECDRSPYIDNKEVSRFLFPLTLESTAEYQVDRHTGRFITPLTKDEAFKELRYYYLLSPRYHVHKPFRTELLVRAINRLTRQPFDPAETVKHDKLRYMLSVLASPYHYPGFTDLKQDLSIQVAFCAGNLLHSDHGPPHIRSILDIFDQLFEVQSPRINYAISRYTKSFGELLVRSHRMTTEYARHFGNIVQYEPGSGLNVYSWMPGTTRMQIFVAIDQAVARLFHSDELNSIDWHPVRDKVQRLSNPPPGWSPL